MAKGPSKKHSKEFKAKVALAALKGNKTAAEICHEYGVAASQVCEWRQVVEKEAMQLFADKRLIDNQKEIDRLHRIIGKIATERDFLSDVLDR
jgi:transposase